MVSATCILGILTLDIRGYRLMSNFVFYENKKFLFYCVVDEESDEYKNLINSLYQISENDRLMQEHLGYYVKQKLINP